MVGGGDIRLVFVVYFCTRTCLDVCCVHLIVLGYVFVNVLCASWLCLFHVFVYTFFRL